MADENFRSYRSRDPVARGEVDPTAREAAGDPLAELARLIGQSGPYGEAGRHERHGPAQSSDDTAASDLDWSADDGYGEQDSRAEDRHAPPPRADAYPSHAPEDRGYGNEPPAGGRYFSGSAGQFNGFRDDTGGDPTVDDARYREEREPAPPVRRSPSFTSGPAEDRYETDEPGRDGGQAYAPEDYYDDAPSPRRRGGFVVIAAVLGLAVIGTAGAFGYRAMFGGSVLPTLPPIIKPADGPNKIMPSYGDTQSSNSSQGNVAGAASTEKLVSHEEQPLDIQEPPKAGPRVVSTIPIVVGQNSAAPSASVPGAAAPAPPSPAVATPSPQMAAPVPPAAPAAAPVSAAPKKVHTVTIRADQPSGLDAAATPPAPATRTASHPPAVAAKPSRAAAAPAGANEPMSLVPAGQGDAPAPVRTRTAVAHAPAAIAEPTPAAAMAPPSGGGYAVQVTSQRSEADAQASFRALQAKFPNQLGGREPIVHRADLGAKGTYYRALVGPFASAEEAAGMCSSLKAAGGNCLVQKN
jgi:hypothetical protein